MRSGRRLLITILAALLVGVASVVAGVVVAERFPAVAGALRGPWGRLVLPGVVVLQLLAVGLIEWRSRRAEPQGGRKIAARVALRHTEFGNKYVPE